MRGRWRVARGAAYWTLILFVGLLSGEVTARLDDRVHYGTAILSAPNREWDLMVNTTTGPRGRPNGNFKRWRLNRYGFRGPEMEESPAPDCTRVMVLGASESFGLYESDGKEFPAQLKDLLSPHGCFEVVNAALPGMSVTSMIGYWESWAARFRPRIVLIYPSPMFYLDDLPPSPKRFRVTEGPFLSPRLFLRAADAYHQLPRFVRSLRERWVIARHTAGKSPDWYFRSLPEDRLRLFVGDLTALALAVKARGAEPVLLTHSSRASDPPEPRDLDDAGVMRMFFPRPRPAVILAFERAAARAVRDLGKRRKIPVVDIAAVMNGRREWFADLVHFNDAGARRSAELVADHIRARSLLGALQ